MNLRNYKNYKKKGAWGDSSLRFRFHFTRSHEDHAFTLIELMVAMAVLMLIGVLLFSLTQATSTTWKRTTERMESFQAARFAFDRIAANLSQAVLNTYWDYDDVSNPTEYERRSELQFLSLPTAGLGSGFPAQRFPSHSLFFQAPTGFVADKGTFGNLPLVLNAFGYFIEYGDDTQDRPGFLPPNVNPQYRYRLKEWRVASEQFTLYAETTGNGGKDFLGAQTLSWMGTFDQTARTLAENVVAFVVSPKNPENPNADSDLLTGVGFVYNSRGGNASSLEKIQLHQLPPEVEIVMVAVDESSFARIFENSSTPPGLGAGLFTDPANLDDDLKTLTNELTNKKLNYIVLRSTVKIRGARWSQD